MILAFVHSVDSSENLLKSAFGLAGSLNKNVGVLFFVDRSSEATQKKKELESYTDKIGTGPFRIFIEQGKISELASACEKHEASFLLIQWNGREEKSLKAQLRYCRDLRIPYLFFKDNFPEISFDKVLLPVGFLVEEYEKTQFASAFGRFYNAEITILLANDYGSKAAITAGKMKAIFDKFQLNYIERKARSDSFKLDKEAVESGVSGEYSIVIISASRDYGPDDLLFGPKEYKLVKKSDIPLLLVNPRGDLYALCE